MGLAGDLTSLLQGGGIQATLQTALNSVPADGSLDASPSGVLATVSLPVTDAELAALTSRTPAPATGDITQTIDRLATLAAPILESLPGVGEVFGPLTTSLELLDQLGTQDLVVTLRDLTGRIATEFEGSDAGLIGRILRVAALLSQAGESSQLSDLLSRLLRSTSIGLPTDVPVMDGLRGLDGTVRALGGLAMLETVLGDAERLTLILSTRFDPVRLAEEVASVERALTGPTPLAAFVAGVSADDPALVDAATGAVVALASKLDTLTDEFAAGFGLGEATLLYMSPERVLQETDFALGIMRGTDTQPLRRVAETLADKLQPLLRLDVSGAATRSLAELISQASTLTAELASQIDAVDVAGFITPVTDTLGVVGSTIGRVNDAIDQALVGFRGIMARVHDAIAALPFGDIAAVLQTFLEPVTAAIDAIRTLVVGIEQTLGEVAERVQAALGHVDGALDAFSAAFDNLFAEAKTFILGLNLDQVLGAVSDQVRAFAELLSRAQMKPYFDTAIDAIGTTADVVSAIPLGLLPDSMKADLDTAVRPVREVDVAAFAAQLEAFLQITPDGKFALRGDIEQAIVDIQREYDNVIKVVEEHDPRKYLDIAEEELKKLADSIHGFSPQLTLAPVREAIDRVKDAILAFDLDQYLAPVRQVFDQILGAIDQYSPSALVAPLQQKLDEVRSTITDAIKLELWAPELDRLVGQGEHLLSIVDEEFLETQLRAILDEVNRSLSQLTGSAASGVGTLLVSLLSGLGLRVDPTSFARVLSLFGVGDAQILGTTETNARAARIADAVLRTRQAVATVDFSSLSGRLVPELRALRSAVQTLASTLPADATARVQLEAALPRLEIEVSFAQLAVNHGRYRALLEASVSQAEVLRRTGYSQVDVTVAQIRAALAPLAPLARLMRQVLEVLGITGFSEGLNGVLRSLFGVLTADRLVQIVSPLLIAVRGRIQALVGAVLTPIRTAIAELQALIAHLDLTPLADAMDSVVQEVKAQIRLLHPDEILKGPLDAFAGLKDDLVNHDPLDEVVEIIEGLQAVIERVLSKLSLEELLKSPLAIYDHILAELKKLRLEGLLDPIFDQLDQLATQVDEGLDGTVSAFQRLQAALPGGSGSSSSGSVSASLGGG